MNDRLIQFTNLEDQPQRLDKLLVAQLPDFSRTRLQGLIKDGFVTVNGQVVNKSGQVIDAGDQIHLRIPPVEPSGLQPQEIPLDIIFENSDLMVINKPAGMVVHPAAGHAEGTLVNAALAHAPEMAGISGELRPGVVHRIDKNTSGLIILAKNDAAHHWLQDQFRLRKVQKTYLALVDGHPPTPSGRIEAAVGRDPSSRKLMAAVTDDKGRQAVSEYRTLEVFPAHTLLEVQPATGRTHQIRVHMKFIGCPIVGDTMYGVRRATLPIERHFLHAWRLVISLPKEPQPKHFEAPLPVELIKVLTSLRSVIT